MEVTTMGFSVNATDLFGPRKENLLEMFRLLKAGDHEWKTSF